MANILVTGGAGYIGSHTCKLLKKLGHNPVTYDNFCRGHRQAVKWGPAVESDLFNYDELVNTIQSYNINAVIHFAAFAYVKESVENPDLYFQNNVYGSAMLLEALRQTNTKKLLFSSTCATYGESDHSEISEDQPQNPINPYGLSKLMVEQLIEKHRQLWGLQACSLRYFNAGGADPELEIGESHDPEPHIIPNILKKGLNDQTVEINGNNYPTPDGTCIRDFIHVMDLAKAHTLVLEELLKNQSLKPAYNLGTGKGTSLLELVKAAETVLNKPIQVEFKAPRPGDPSQLIASNKLFKNDFNWEPEISNIEKILETGLAWIQNKKF